MNIELLDINIQGFRSIQKAYFSFSDHIGINIIKGSNGIGKSTLIESISWVLYGMNLKGTKADQISTWKWVRNDDFRGTRVVIRIKVDSKVYVIARMHKFKGLTFEKSVKNGILIYSEEGINNSIDKATSQNFINRLLKVDSKTFLNSVLFGQRLQKFIEASNEDKRKIFESLFDLTFIDEARENAKTQLSDLNNELSELAQKHSLLESSRLQQISEYSNYKKILDNFDEELTKERNLFEQKLAFNIEGYNRLINNTVLPPEPEIQLKSFYDKRSPLESEVAKKQYLIGDLANQISLGGVCSTCGGKYDIDLESLNSKMKVLEEESNKLNEQIQFFNSEISKAQAHNEKIKEDKRKYDNYSQSLVIYENKVKASQEALNNLSDRKRPDIDLSAIQSKIEGLEIDIQTYRDAIAEKTKHKEYLDYWYSTGFGPNGIKTYISESMMSMLNNYVNKYSQKFGYKVIASYDLSKSRKSLDISVYKNGNQIDYNELSGGQKSRVDVSLAFAIHDMLSSSVSKFNVLFLDEFFEGMDEEGMYEVFELLREKSINTIIFLITHNQNMDVRNTKTIELNYQNGLTEIV